MASIIPIFIPHEGCPHSCVFCNQNSISGSSAQRVTPAEVTATIETWLDRFLSKQAYPVQVAFYGGSFTGLESQRQQELLGAVTPFLDQGRVHQIRLSTRPDYIDKEKLALLKQYQVGIVELGVQSLDDPILRQAGRGHSKGDVYRAVELLQKDSFQVGMQLMLGLPGQAFSSLRRTVAQTILLQPDFVRIYPVLVVVGSGLEKAYQKGIYTPLSLGKAVLQAAYMKKNFDREGIRVIRMGLQPGESLERSLLAGPYHPSFGEMVLSRLMLKQTRSLLQGQDESCPALVINSKDMSIFKGIRSTNMHRLSELGLLDCFSLRTDDSQARFQVTLRAN